MPFRAFIAFDVDEKIRRQIKDFVEELKRTRINVKWVPLVNMHLTLKFLGDIEQPTVDAIKRICLPLVEKFLPISIEIKEIGGFPRLQHPRVLWIGCYDAENRIVAMQKELDNGLKKLGFQPEKREYHPHITIGRVKGLKNIDIFLEKIKEQKVYFGKQELFSFGLYKSNLLPTGAVYSVVEEFI